MVENLLTVSNLKTYFYTSMGVVKAVDDIDFKIGLGQSVGLVGESGCGKSMTAFSIMRQVPNPGRIISGTILFKDINLLDLDEKKMMKIRGKEVSMVFQDPNTYLNPLMKVKDQIAEVISLHQSIKKDELMKKIINSLEKVRIPSPTRVSNYYPQSLSGGMRQRILIAMAIACNPALLIADEPTTALDVTVQKQILKLMKDLKKELGSLLMITHDLGIVAEICDIVNVMYAGKIIENSNVFEIFEKPLHPYTQGLLASVLSIDHFKKKLVTIEGSVPDLINPPQGCRFHPRCKHVKEVCHREVPYPVEAEPGHTVACWLYQSR
jgi:oligopeptide/dipeptide ABC transporter ATP-binding protein